MFQYERNVKRITKNEANDTWVVNTEDGKDIEADALVLSMGGSSFSSGGDRRNGIRHRQERFESWGEPTGIRR